MQITLNNVVIKRVENPTDEQFNEYLRTYKDIFSSVDFNHVPKKWYIAYLNEEILGVMSVNEFNSTTVYLQYAGVKSEYQGNWDYYSIFNHILKDIKEKDGFQQMMCVADRKNVRAIKMLLNAGFLISGMRQIPGSNDPFYVEFVRPL